MLCCRNRIRRSIAVEVCCLNCDNNVCADHLAFRSNCCRRYVAAAKNFHRGGGKQQTSLSIYRIYCCDRKSRAAYAQSFALWQQATIEFTCHGHSSRTLLLRSIVDIVSITRDYTPRSLYNCLFAPHICMVLLFTHIPFVVNHTINATPPERLQQHPLLFTTNHTDRTFFV